MFTSAKALGGGMPIDAMMAKGEAATVFGPGDHASTYSGNTLACAAGLAVAEYISEHDVLGNVNERGDQLSAGLEDIAKRYPSVLGEVLGWGLFKGVVIKDDVGCTAAELVGDAMKEGLLFRHQMIVWIHRILHSAKRQDMRLARIGLLYGWHLYLLSDPL